MIQQSENLTNRELQEYEQHKEMFDKNAEFELEKKKLEIQHLNIESKIGAWFRLPVTIIKMPLYLLIGLALIVYAIRGAEPPEKLLNLINK